MLKVFNVVKKRREVILEKKDLLTLLEILDDVQQETRRGVIMMDMEIGKCDVDNDSEWFIFFNVSDRHFASVIDKLDTEANKHLVLKDDLRFYLV